YFAHAYNLYQEAVEIEGKSPSPRQLYSLISRAKAEKVKVVFVQPQFDRKGAQAVAHAIGGEVVPLDPLAEDVSGNLKIMAEKIQSALNQQ
ncbi:MAG: zinc ABC transporter substrate-binding protein, partial [Deltaproteobacteria bacterium]|nr:zinc ABC transporter substrate-binding protein [Deltaproteobacteria bacterium]